MSGFGLITWKTGLTANHSLVLFNSNLDVGASGPHHGRLTSATGRSIAII